MQESAIIVFVAAWASNASFMCDFDDYADADDYDSCGYDWGLPSWAHSRIGALS